MMDIYVCKVFTPDFLEKVNKLIADIVDADYKSNLEREASKDPDLGLEEQSGFDRKKQIQNVRTLLYSYYRGQETQLPAKTLKLFASLASPEFTIKRVPERLAMKLEQMDEVFQYCIEANTDSRSEIPVQNNPAPALPESIARLLELHRLKKQKS